MLDNVCKTRPAPCPSLPNIPELSPPNTIQKWTFGTIKCVRVFFLNSPFVELRNSFCAPWCWAKEVDYCRSSGLPQQRFSLQSLELLVSILKSPTSSSILYSTPTWISWHFRSTWAFYIIFYTHFLTILLSKSDGGLTLRLLFDATFATSLFILGSLSRGSCLRVYRQTR